MTKNVKIQVPVDVNVKSYKDCVNVVGISMRRGVMFTTYTNKFYGSSMWDFQKELIKHANESFKEERKGK